MTKIIVVSLIKPKRTLTVNSKNSVTGTILIYKYSNSVTQLYDGSKGGRGDDRVNCPLPYSSEVSFVAGGGQRPVVVLELPHLLGHGQVAFFHGQLVFGLVDGQTLSAAAVPQLFGLQ